MLQLAGEQRQERLGRSPEQSKQVGLGCSGLGAAFLTQLLAAAVGRA